jgi:5-oxoprolinase (ATP-hydrolysing)
MDETTGQCPQRWEFWIDRGGTFTDIVARLPGGGLRTHKLLSEHPERYRDAAVAGIRHVLGLSAQEPITPERVACVKMGTTVATNALLERKGEPTVLVTTRGFRDGLRIGYQNRPRLFDRHIVLPELLYSEVIEAQERMGAHGEQVQALDEAALQAALQAAHARGLRSVAIVFLHGYRYTAHEVAAARLARAVGFTQVSTSHGTSPLMKWVSRGDTTVVDAYLSPLLRRYVEQLAHDMPGVPLYFMQSSGGLTSALAFQGKDAILSGPAGGIVGMARTATLAGLERVIGFDMGGTSTDVSHYAGAFEREFETQVAGVRMRAPMMNIHTVAAGGGSIVRFDGARFRVGPDSAGAAPGPACYRRGGPLTVTDANVLLGKIQPRYFPQVFGPLGSEPLSRSVVDVGFAQLAQRSGRTAQAVAEGFVHIAVQQMANAIKKISVARGYDVTRYTLQCFGGAGGQHACLVADALGMTQVLVHPMAGVLSAYGMGLADQNAMREQAVERPLEAQAMPELMRQLDALAAAVRAEWAGQHPGHTGAVQVHRRVHVRYEGSDAALVLPWGASVVGGLVPGGAGVVSQTGPVGGVDRVDRVYMATLAADLTAGFEAAYQQRFAFLMTGRRQVVEAVSVELVALGDLPQEPRQALHPVRPPPVRPEVAQGVPVYSGGQWHAATLVVRDDLRPGDEIDGPAIIAESHATTVVEPGWQARVTALNHLLLVRTAARPQRLAVGTTVDPVLLEVFNNLFMNIAEQMGLQLQNTAHSVNIKERLDFSCALFDAQGHLIANAPHMPVHLGSMGESIQTVIRDNAGRIHRGDVFVLNDPYNGGTHLPDVTVITPVFAAPPPGQAQPSPPEHEPSDLPLFYVGSRGHHADIGGITPGSMPPFSTRIDEEGVQIHKVKLVDRGVLQEAAVLHLLSTGGGTTRWPSRNPQQNLADLKAQIAANEKGVQELCGMVAHYGLPVVQAYMGHVQDNAEAAVRRAIGQLARRLRQGAFTLPLDNGAQITVRVALDAAQCSAVIDFTGTSAQLPNNFNAPRAVCMAAVLYVFRSLVDDDIPLNAGCLKPLRVIIPSGSMLNPLPPASVVAGNVETSTCITNALMGALGIMAGGQPTMNNFTFGNERYQYYETIAGGSGAGGVFDGAGVQVGGFDGTSVVQTHMTNSRLTDPEVLELRFPVRLESYALRTGSGGQGRWCGGDGGVRRIRFLEPMTASILSNGRSFAAFGLAGGEPGQCGVNRVVRADGRVETLGHIGSTAMAVGDVFEIHTPGGGGFGPVSD